jgi:hypothetical protein
MRRTLLRTAFTLLSLAAVLPGVASAAPAAQPAPTSQKITVTLVRWPYT